MNEKQTNNTPRRRNQAFRAWVRSVLGGGKYVDIPVTQRRDPEPLPVKCEVWGREEGYNGRN
jgi:hypothetical protein